MAKKTKKSLNNENLQLGLAAIGAAGGWEIAIDETRAGSAEKWFVEIEGPSVYLTCEVQSPHIIQQMIEYLTNGPDADNRTCELVLGKNNGVSASLLRDDEFDDRYFLVVQTRDSLTVRITISGKEVESFVLALRQANEDVNG
jgi:hypothetical protein